MFRFKQSRAIVAVSASGLLIAGLGLAPSSFAAAAPNPVPTSPITITGAGSSAGAVSVGASTGNVRTSVWKQNNGDYTSPTGSSVQAARITTKTEMVYVGTGKARRKVPKTSDVVSHLTIYSTNGQAVNDVRSATTASGITTVFWSVADSGADTVTLYVRRISASGTLGATEVVAPSGTTAYDLRVASSASGRSLAVWRTDDTQVSWVEGRVFDKTNSLRPVIELSPNHGSYHDVVVAARANGAFDLAWRNGNGARPMTQSVRVSPTDTVSSPLNLGAAANASNDDQAIAAGPDGMTVVAWTESTNTAWILKVAKIDPSGRVKATVELSRLNYPYLPALGIAADGTTTVAWLYSSGTSARVRAIRLAANNSKSKVLDFGPSKETLVPGSGPALTVATNGTATMAWSVVTSAGFPQPLYLQAFQISPDGRKILSTRLVTPSTANPDLDHAPVVASSPDGTAVIAYRKASAYGGPAVLKLTSWK